MTVADAPEASDDRPLVSVIVPSYNHEAFVEATIRSVWAQTYRPLELVALDDGSRDRSPEILRALAAESPIPMTVRVKPNEGLCATLNLGVSLCHGRYVAMVASDDMFLPHSVERWVEAVRGTPARVAGSFGYARYVDEGGRDLGRTSHRCTPAELEDLFLGYLMFRVGVLLQTCMLKREIYEEVGVFDTSLRFDDRDFLLRLLRDHELVYVDSPQILYREVAGSMSQGSPRYFDDFFTILEKHLGSERLARPGYPTEAQIRAATHRRLAVSAYNLRELRLCRHHAREALRLDPTLGELRALYLRSLLGARLIRTLSRVREAMRDTRRPTGGAGGAP